ncbi:hypothetical protein NQ314_010316 [Rhamnusium bicolor]|uniref:NADP-dependent oxidoreductase domain-containing protein n=1 Tax=Rhamnusium bicolor TaxID=1586634 RepID=A0AAV8XRT6_9CUCU|nr:hypothetical protein NQ314_010316 [Rhamnusium bicolor]
MAMKFIKLSSGNAEIPIVGLGTWRAQPEEVQNAVLVALEKGYRHIDTAFNYNNEDAIGDVLTKWFETGKGKREDLFITTKLPNFGNRPKDAERFLKMSLERLKLSYVDLYLIHMPFSFVCNESNFTPQINEDGTFRLDVDNDIVGTWKDVIVIPKSSNPVRIQANIDLFDFELTEDDMEELDALDKGEKGRIFDFLFFKGVEKHPEYPF